MVFRERVYTVEEFDAFVEQPANADKLFEFIEERLLKYHRIHSHPISPCEFCAASQICGRKQSGFCDRRGRGYMVSGERYAPDVAYLSRDRQPTLARQGYNPTAPDLAVEVDFPSTYKSQKELLTKVVNYLAAGTVVWLVLPEVQEVEVYAPGKPKRLLTIDSVLDGGDVMPGFTLDVKDIFVE